MWISQFMCFNNNVAMDFIFILDYRNDVRQKANSSAYFIRVQNGL